MKIKSLKIMRNAQYHSHKHRIQFFKSSDSEKSFTQNISLPATEFIKIYVFTSSLCYFWLKYYLYRCIVRFILLFL